MSQQRISRIVEKWYMCEPLFFAIWTTHELIQNPHINTIRVGRGKIEYKDTFIQALTDHTLEQVLQCEVMRLLLKHPYLRKKNNSTLCYLASNITLQEYLNTPIPFPNAEQVFQTHDYNQQYFEFYYQKLIKHTDHISPVIDHAELASYSNPEKSGLENTAYWDKDDYHSAILNETIDRAFQNNAWGSLSRNLQELIVATLTPKINYRDILKSFRASIISVKHVLTRQKPSRRYGFLYLGSRRDFCTKLLFAVDVSGSVTSEDLTKAFSIINQLFKYGIESINVLQFDSTIKGKPLSLKKAKSTIQVIGRGGTDFQPLITYIDHHTDYDGLIIFTDGWAPVPTRPKNKRTKILWLFNHEINYLQMRNHVKPIGSSTFIQ